MSENWRPPARLDPQETSEWMQSLDAVISSSGPETATWLLQQLQAHASTAHGLQPPGAVITDYINTISPANEVPYPGDLDIEKRIRAIIRWNAVAMVTRANMLYGPIGGHLATFASAASLYDVGFHHFFRAPSPHSLGDSIFIQGHAAPGIYARSFLEGRLSEEDLDKFRRETVGGLSSYPHPRRMPNFWQFPTVSMGLGVMNSMHQARMNKYLQDTNVIPPNDSQVWCFAGDGEMDEPESTASLSLAAREGLGNLTLVVNCNLQRLDGPVRGNGKIAQELEGKLRGAGWHVIKVLWGGQWDPLLAQDHTGALIRRMNTVPDGEFQRYSLSDGETVRRDFFNTPELAELVAELSSRDIERLPRGGHDSNKIFQAYKKASLLIDAPVAILIQTVKGWALGSTTEARNATHQIKKLSIQEMRILRTRLELPIPDSCLTQELPPYFHPGENSSEVEYLNQRRSDLGGPLPYRHHPISTPNSPLSPNASLDAPFAELRQGSDLRAVSTTQVVVKLVKQLVAKTQNPATKEPLKIIPIISDEARTFGLDVLFSLHGIYSPTPQRYTPVDAGLPLSYSEKTDGLILEEGISEAAALADFTALATAHSTWGLDIIPMFFFYSMFGFQRVGDLIWNLADARGRGFLFGATAGRTTLEGEGLQHCDGHSLLLASTVPSVVSYDCAYAYELAAVIESGLARMTTGNEDLVFYLTLYNEPYPHPPQNSSISKSDILSGASQVFSTSNPDPDPVSDLLVDGLSFPTPPLNKIRLFASGPFVEICITAAKNLQHLNVPCEVYSITSYSELRREAMEVDRLNNLHPLQPPQQSFISALGDLPVVAVSDWMKIVPEMVKPWISNMETLGTDGFGLSDTRDALRDHFEVSTKYIIAAGYRQAGASPAAQDYLQAALSIDAEKPSPY